ncbi:MAG TPA: helix-turn-helix domain-containing protein [Myxococcales bacterium]|nr:helix-turn-helix domain-containing protein [Myxococcales bacterium]
MKLFTRYRILNAARSMVGELGVERVTMRGVAARANITAPAIYRHFRNKRHLLDEVVASGYRELGQNMLRASSTPSGARGLRTAIDQGIAFARRHPRLTEMMLAPRTRDEEPIYRLRQQVERCMREGSMARDDSRKVALVLWAQMRGQLSMRQEGGHDRVVWLFHQSVEHALKAAD